MKIGHSVSNLGAGAKRRTLAGWEERRVLVRLYSEASSVTKTLATDA